ncbi:hypothetical protein [Rubeoparvulum massiliense]|uniref:hypothetical protein n=1 Tax=Rubeoparvulum massiliense TaxID=1631346 RepID=UPI00065DCB2B|nr:hypothetical protein [Rubeoparvulum massiliense]
MKKSFKLIVGIATVILFCLMIYSYFIVSGDEIIGVSNITTTSNVVIRKSYLGVTNEQEYLLNANQIEMLKTLILQSDFTRNLSTAVRFNDKDMYTIIIKDSEANVWLNIDCIGNEWISIANQFNGKHLRINNPNWKKTLEEIILLSN